MSLKNRDNHNRWRNKTVSFRVSLEEDAQIETFVKLSGLTKQDYITRRLTCKDVVVQGNPRVYKALRDQLATVLDELRRIEAGGINDELLDVIEMIAAVMDGMKEEKRLWRMISAKRKRPPQTHLLAQMMGSRFTIQLRTVYPLLKKKSTVIFKNSEESLDEIYRRIQRLTDPHYLHTISMTELYQTVYQRAGRPSSTACSTREHISSQERPKSENHFWWRSLPTMSAQGKGCGAMKSIRVRFCTLHWRMISRESRAGCL